MKRILYGLLLITLLAGCNTATPQPTVTPTQAPTTVIVPTATNTPVPPTATALPPTATIVPTATTLYPTEGRGPTSFAAGINPLTGLPVTSPDLLNRRPAVVKVENLPRDNRPQWGLSVADIVYEYYTEMGSTRFAAVFYGQDAEKVGPVRSARFFDINVVRMYKSTFLFGSADERVRDVLWNSEFAARLVLEGTYYKDVFSRFEPNKANIMLANLTKLSAGLAANKVDNSRQSQDGMFFSLNAPADGKPAAKVFTRFSGSIYNRWDYDAASGRYLRWADAIDDPNRTDEKYTQLTDRLTLKPIAAENVVMLFVAHKYVMRTATAEQFEVNLIGQGKAYIARDGQIYEVKWKRTQASDVLTLVDASGKVFPFKPGQTWFEVFHDTSTVATRPDNGWLFSFIRP